MLGVSAMHAVSRSLESARDMALAILLVLPVSSLFCYLAFEYILIPVNLDFLRLPVFVLLIILCSSFLKHITMKFNPGLSKRVDVYLPLLMVNSSLLGAALLVIEETTGLMSTLAISIGSALGFGVVLIMFSAMRKNIERADTPTPFQGPAVLLITLAILSMAFMGFSGL